MVQGAGGLGGAEAVGRRDDGPARCAPDPGVFQLECIDAFVASQVAQLVQFMGNFTVSQTGSVALSAQDHQALEATIAQTWQPTPH